MPVPTSQPAPTVKQNVAQSGAEVRAFVASLKGKSPAEAMGVVARSGLARGMILSLLIQVVLVVAVSAAYALWPHEPAAARPQGEAPSVAPAPLTDGAPAQPATASASDAAPAENATSPAPAAPPRTVKPPTSDVEDLDAADAIDRGLEE